MIGDSILRGVKGIPDTEVHCFPGHSLKKLGSLLLDPSRYNLDKFDMVIVHGGTIDLFKVSPPQVMRTVSDLVASFRRISHAHIAFSCVLPRPRDEHSQGEMVKQFNSALISWCKENGCVCLRTYSPFLQGGRAKRHLFKLDMLHPRPRGKPPTGLFILNNFLRSQLSEGILGPRLRQAEWSRQGEPWW